MKLYEKIREWVKPKTEEDSLCGTRPCTCTSPPSLAIIKASLDPEAKLSYSEICDIALSFKGYEWIQKKYKIEDDNDDALFWKCVRKEEYPNKNMEDLSLEQLRFELFIRQRGVRWGGEEPEDWDIEYMTELCHEILSRDTNEEKLRSLIV